ncbi:MAG: LysM peptidoglycan-binding domain-containing protein [Anaerolineales bacterium]|nr:LysM peptidoglycan-binding domain-containing protein [Anaerolineales bacterium]MCC6985404.1 LysM peptidoglycan-binding domain-containing protein [Anaerolineales bacterium]
MSHSKISLMALLAALLFSCAPAAETPVVFPTYDPFVPSGGNTTDGPENQPPVTSTETQTAIPTSTPTRPPTPTRVPLNISPLIGVQDQITSGSPTPDTARILPTPRQEQAQHTVQPGDTLGSIALQYNISLQALMDANNITDPNTLEVGMILVIPAPEIAAAPLNSLKIIPDSELVHSPAAARFNARKFIASQGGYLNQYAEEVRGIVLNGADIIEGVSFNYSVNPRILLALLEYQSGWVTNPNPVITDYPMGYADPNKAGLYRQVVWAANMLNRGYYLWKANAISTLVLTDGQTISIDPTINAGTVGVQYFFSELDGYDAWQYDTGVGGAAVTYFVFFGNPFNYAIEPLIPPTLSQPPFSLPFAEGESWYFTGGPHAAWDSGSAWGALDFAPQGNAAACDISPYWVTAMADGLITRTGTGSVIQDLDNDGYEQTGWVLIYMHVSSQQRVTPGEYIYKNERIGHPSCEGGISNATHVHVARKYNGEWIAADGALPFNLGGWVSSGTGNEYDGYLSAAGYSIEALDAAQPENLITR